MKLTWNTRKKMEHFGQLSRLIGRSKACCFSHAMPFHSIPFGVQFIFETGLLSFLKSVIRSGHFHRKRKPSPPKKKSIINERNSSALFVKFILYLHVFVGRRARFRGSTPYHRAQALECWVKWCVWSNLCVGTAVTMPQFARFVFLITVTFFIYSLGF